MGNWMTYKIPIYTFIICTENFLYIIFPIHFYEYNILSFIQITDFFITHKFNYVFICHSLIRIRKRYLIFSLGQINHTLINSVYKATLCAFPTITVFFKTILFIQQRFTLVANPRHIIVCFHTRIYQHFSTPFADPVGQIVAITFLQC